MKAIVGIMILLGTGWILGILMAGPKNDAQTTLAYFFIIVNSTQVCVIKYDHIFLVVTEYSQ